MVGEKKSEKKNQKKQNSLSDHNPGTHNLVWALQQNPSCSKPLQQLRGGGGGSVANGCRVIYPSPSSRKKF